MRLSPPNRLDAFKSEAQEIVSAPAQARDCAELDEIFAPRIECLGYQSSGYLRMFGEGHFISLGICSEPRRRYGPNDIKASNIPSTAACRLTGKSFPAFNQRTSGGQDWLVVPDECRNWGIRLKETMKPT